MEKTESVFGMQLPAEGNMAEMWERGRVRASAQPVGNEFLLEWRGQPFMIRGGLVVLKGKPKAGKTFALDMLEAALLAGEYEGLGCLAEGLRVMHLDTEQMYNDTAWVMARIREMTGMADELDARLALVNLRCCGSEERMRMLEYGMETFRPDVVVIDNVADMIDGMDYNDIRSASSLVTRLAALSEERRCTIVCTIHENGTDGRASGWVGRIFLQKCDLELTVSKDEATGLRTLAATACRHAGMPSISFGLQENEGRVVLPVVSYVPVAGDADRMSRKFRKQFKGIEWGSGLKHARLIDEMVRLHGSSSARTDAKAEKKERDKFRKQIDVAFRAGFLTHSGDVYNLKENRENTEISLFSLTDPGKGNI